MKQSIGLLVYAFLLYTHITKPNKATEDLLESSGNWRSQQENFKKLLAEGADVNIPNADGVTAFMKTVDSRHPKRIKVLLDESKEPISDENMGYLLDHLDGKLETFDHEQIDKARTKLEVIIKHNKTLSFLRNDLKAEAFKLHYTLVTRAKKYLEDGEKLFNELASGKRVDVNLETQEESIENIVSLYWYFYSKAVEKKQTFTSGTFIIHGKQYMPVFDYLFSYVRKYNPKVKSKMSKDNEDCKAGKTGGTNPWGYPRLSTHFDADGSEKYSQFGIDVRTQDHSDPKALKNPNPEKIPHGDLQELLPANRRHILCGKLNETSFFMKAESQGLLRGKDMINHGLALLTKTANVGTRREDVPKEATKLFKKLQPNKKAEFIRDMVKAFKEGSAEAKKFASYCTENQLDHPEIRWGGEVILTSKEFDNSFSTNSYN